MKFISKNLSNISNNSVLILLVLLVGLNFLIAQKYIYFDLTNEKIYTTSEASKNILKNLNKDVSVNFYISKDLPVDLENAKVRLVDLMNQYQDIAGSKLKISYNSPENSKEKAMELAQKGIMQAQFNIVAKDKYEVKQGFFGAEITSGEGDNLKRESIPFIQSVDNMEYDLISAVYSVSRESKENIAFLDSHGEKQIQIPDLEKSYNISTVKIESHGDKKGFYFEKEKTDPSGQSKDKKPEPKEKIFIEPITLIIAGPTGEISKEEISVIDDYVKNGGNLIVLAESVAVDLNNNLNATPIKNNLNELLGKYGIKINSDLVYDQTSSNITYQQGFFSVSKPYFFWVKAVKDNFGNSPALSGTQALVFPWVSSISLSDSGSYNAKALISSSGQSDTLADKFNLLPDAQLYFGKGGKKIIAAFSEAKDKNSKSGSVFAIGDSDFISPNFLAQIPDNKTFFMNLVDSVSNSVHLSTIRAKTIIDRPIKDIGESDKNYWKIVSVFGAAIALDIYGFFRIMRRKKLNI